METRASAPVSHAASSPSSAASAATSHAGRSCTGDAPPSAEFISAGSISASVVSAYVISLRAPDGGGGTRICGGDAGVPGAAWSICPS